MKRKSLKVLIVLLVFSFLLTNIYATDSNANVDADFSEGKGTNEIGSVNDRNEGIFDVYVNNDVYKESLKNTRLPFLRYVSQRIVIDKDISNIGVMFSAKSIDILNDIYAPQLIVSNDIVSINGKISDAIILSNGNVNINGSVDGSLIICSSGSVIVNKEASVQGDIIVYCPTLKIDGSVNKNVLGSVSQLDGTGEILGDIRISANDILNSNLNVVGQKYFNLYNLDQKLPENYKDATVNLINNDVPRKDTLNISKILIISFLFTLMYIGLNKTNIINKQIEKVKKYPAFTVISGALIIMVFPLVLFISILLSTLDLAVISLPIILIYMSFVISFSILSNFVVGTLIVKYICSKYQEKLSSWYKYVFTFAVFLVMQLIVKIPFIGMYITMVLAMLSIGIVFTGIFKKVGEVK